MPPRTLAEAVGPYARGELSDEQVLPLVREVFANGLSRTEIAELTTAMISSGTRLDFSSFTKPVVDKHSTGGVGDKITLILTPLLASCGVLVTQLAGRGLGFTGGTIDKLESIPGWTPNLTPVQMSTQLETVGAFIACATSDIVPADARLYALRDVTNTVASIPLIASSIMSKKIAEGTRNLVLDVKFGRGAFMSDIDHARALARVMVQLGEDEGVHTRALLTDMNTPLGYAVGNANEVAEALEVLQGRGPRDVRELTLALAREALNLAGITEVDPAEYLDNGTAFEKWTELIISQGGDPYAPLPTPQHSAIVSAESEGYLLDIDARVIAEVSWALGAGRRVVGEKIDLTAGVQLHAQHGDHVLVGQPLFTLMTSDVNRLESARATLATCYSLGSRENIVDWGPRVAERITT